MPNKEIDKKTFEDRVKDSDERISQEVASYLKNKSQHTTIIDKISLDETDFEKIATAIKEKIIKDEKEIGVKALSADNLSSISESIKNRLRKLFFSSGDPLQTSGQSLASSSAPAKPPAPTPAKTPESAPAPTPAKTPESAPTPAKPPESAPSKTPESTPASAPAPAPAPAQDSSESQMSEIKYLDNSGDIFVLIQAEIGNFNEGKNEFSGTYNSTLCKVKFSIAEIGYFEINFSLIRLLENLDKQYQGEFIKKTWQEIFDLFKEDENKIFFEEEYNSNHKKMPAWKILKPDNYQILLEDKKFTIKEKLNIKEFINAIKKHDIEIREYLLKLKQAMEEEIKQDGDRKIFPIWKQDYFHPPKIFFQKNASESLKNLEGDVSSKEVKIDDLLKLIERTNTEMKEKIESGKIVASAEIEVTVKIQKKAYYNLKSRPDPIIDLDHNKKLKKSLELLNSLESSSSVQASTAISCATASNIVTATQTSTSASIAKF